MENGNRLKKQIRLALAGDGGGGLQPRQNRNGKQQTIWPPQAATPSRSTLSREIIGSGKSKEAELLPLLARLFGFRLLPQ